MKVKICFSIILLLSVVSCSQPYAQKSFQKRVEPKTELPKPKPITATLADKIKNASHIHDIFSFGPITTFKNLETYNFATLTKVLRVGPNWLLFDAYSQSVVLADADGQAFTRVGGPGQGPGEHDRISDVFRIWDDQIAVVNFGKIDIFDSNGLYQREVTVQVGSETFHTVFELIWNHPETLVITDFPSRTKGMPAHGIFKFDGQRFMKHAAFGQRFYETLEVKNGTPMVTLVMTQIGQHLWTSSQYRSEFEVYDWNGHLIKRLPIQHSETRTESDFQNIRSPQAFYELVNNTYGAYKILEVGPLVFAFYAGKRQVFCNIYDKAGSLLRRHLPSYPGLIQPADSDADTLYFMSDSATEASLWRTLLQPEDLERLQEQGIDTTSSEEPPFVWQSQLP